jgi:signal peptidase
VRRFRRILSLGLQALVVVAVVGMVSVMFVPRLLGWQLVTVLSGSMTPAYPVESVVAVRPVDPTSVRVGDVITFMTRPGAPPVTHRVVSVEKASRLEFVTKGDANEDADPNRVAAANVRGRVVFGVPYFGRLVRALHTRAGLLLLLVLPVLVLLAGQLKSTRTVSQESGPAVPEGSVS